MIRSHPSPETLTGSIERVTFHNPDNGFAVLKVATRGHHDLATVVGHLASAITGEVIEATGRCPNTAPDASQDRSNQRFGHFLSRSWTFILDYDVFRWTCCYRMARLGKMAA